MLFAVRGATHLAGWVLSRRLPAVAPPTVAIVAMVIA